MSWMTVEIKVEDKIISNIINIETIVRFGPRLDGSSYMRFVDGSTVELADSFDSITQAILKAQGK